MLHVIEVGVSCRILYFIVIYLFVSCSGSIFSIGEGVLCLLVLGIGCYFIVALLGPSIHLL